jgi:hypothetical protein
MVYIRRFVNVAVTGGKRKVRALPDGDAAKLTGPDEPQPDDLAAAGNDGNGGGGGARATDEVVGRVFVHDLQIFMTVRRESARDVQALGVVGVPGVARDPERVLILLRCKIIAKVFLNNRLLLDVIGPHFCGLDYSETC